MTQVKISDVLEMLAAGLDRSEIRAHYKLSHAESVALFKHEKLAGVRKAAKLNLSIIDDTAEDYQEVAEVEIQETPGDEQDAEPVEEEVKNADESVSIEEEEEVEVEEAEEVTETQEETEEVFPFPTDVEEETPSKKKRRWDN